MKINYTLKAMYICVKDMNRAIDFYENLLGFEVETNDKIYSVFNIDGFRFGLFAYNEVKQPKKWGNSCLPSLEVDDLDNLKLKLEQLKRPIVFPETIIGKYRVLEFTDSEGNDIEATCLV